MSRQNTDFTTNENSETENDEIITNEDIQKMYNECYMLDSPMLSIEKVEKIHMQMKKSVVEIYNFLSKSTGFFCKIKIDNNSEIIVLITALHGIEGSKKLLLRNKEKSIEIDMDDSRIIYNNENCDISIIEIKDSDKVNKHYCLELDERYNRENGIHNYNNKPGYIVGYPCHKECTFSYGKIKVMEGNNKTYIRHTCSTYKGSSGSPIILFDSLKCIGIHLQGSKKSNRGNFLFSSIHSFIYKYKKYKKVYTSISNEKNKSKNIQKNTYINKNNMNLKFEEGLGYPNNKNIIKSFTNNEINSFYKNLNKNKLNKQNILNSNLSSSFTETINIDNESMEDSMEDTKIETKNINCKNMMINHFEFKKNESLENKKKIPKNEIKKKINSLEKINLISNNKLIKNIEKQKTWKYLIFPKKENIKILPINQINSNKIFLNTSNLPNSEIENNININNFDKRINKKFVKRISGIYDTINNNNNINIIKNPLENQIIVNKINEIKKNIKKEKNDFLNPGKLSPRNIREFNDNLNAYIQSKQKKTKATN